MQHEPTAPPIAAFDESEKVGILMNEYNNLRTQITHRTNNGFQLITVGGAVVVWLLSRAADMMTQGIPLRKDWPFGVCIVIALIAVGLGARYIFRDIDGAKLRLVEIQKRVNDLAGESNLLQGPARQR